MRISRSCCVCSEVAVEEPETSPIKEPSPVEAAPVDPTAFGGPYEPHVSLVLQFDNVRHHDH